MRTAEEYAKLADNILSATPVEWKDWAQEFGSEIADRMATKYYTLAQVYATMTLAAATAEHTKALYRVNDRP